MSGYDDPRNVRDERRADAVKDVATYGCLAVFAALCIGFVLVVAGIVAMVWGWRL